MQLIVTVNKLNKRTQVPPSLTDKTTIAGVVLKGYTFEGTPVPVNDPALGKWYRDRNNFYYWGGGLLAVNGNVPKPVNISGLPENLPPGFILGADVSHHNNKPDWPAIVNAGAQFVWIKISEGVGSPDPMAATHATNAHNAGLAIGYYHFGRPDKRNAPTVAADATAEADEAFKIISKLPAPSLTMAVDLENESNWDTPLTKDEYNIWVETFCARTEALQGRPPVLYTYKAYMDTKLPKGHELGRFKLWQANYTVKDCNKLVCASGWQDWAVWQFTGSASLGGNKKLDLSIMKDTSLLL
jgi:GH25 family lysozyme M1 (1,4-beta-N-acetylmuramidase)